VVDFKAGDAKNWNHGDNLKVDSNSESITIDPSHELYLYPSDSLNHFLVSTSLDGYNHGHWRKAVKIALVAKNKIGFVRGTCSYKFAIIQSMGSMR